MNNKFDIKYLTGGDKFYGPDFGAATVDTQVRKGYLQECPNVAKLLDNLAFDVEYENKGMDYIMNGGMSPEDAARQAIKDEPQRMDAAEGRIDVRRAGWSHCRKGGDRPVTAILQDDWEKRKQYVELPRGRQLAFIDTGGPGPVLLMLHGFRTPAAASPCWSLFQRIQAHRP